MNMWCHVVCGERDMSDGAGLHVSCRVKYVQYNTSMNAHDTLIFNQRWEIKFT